MRGKAFGEDEACFTPATPPPARSGHGEDG